MMKKNLGIALAMMLTMSLAGCGSSSSAPAATTAAETTAAATTAAETTVEETTTEAASEETTTEETTTEEATEETTAEAETTGSNVLVAYFSWSGNTEELANMIHEEAGGDIFQIVPVEPYTDDYDALLDQAQAEQRNEARPEIANQIDNWDDYDVIFMGYPNWWGDTPMIIKTFMESYDFTGKTVIPFCTHGSGGFGRSLGTVESGLTGATLLDGFEVSGSNVSGAGDEVAAWVSGLEVLQ